MHELSIAMSLVDVACEEAHRLGARVTALHVQVGPLSGVVTDALLSAYGLACEGSPLEGSRLLVREMPVIAFCPTCQAERRIESIQHICCPVCDTPTPDIRGGRELLLVGLEILDEHAQLAGDEHADADRAGAPAGAQAE